MSKQALDKFTVETAGSREFDFSLNDFNRLRILIGEKTGIHLTDSKRELVYSRLARRLRQHGLRLFSQYCDMLEAGHDDELSIFMNSLTTNMTSFYREKHHFDYLARELVPGLLEKARSGQRVRIWSAGCSTGEEPYSIAMTLLESAPDLRNHDVRILATDLNTEVVARAQNGIYSHRQIEGLSVQQRNRWFQQGTGKFAEHARIKDPVRRLITFLPLNLMDPWPMSGPFDIIFCRNVVIYFEREIQCRLFDRFASILHDTGTLFIGHSETLHNLTDSFGLVAKTTYRKV